MEDKKVSIIIPAYNAGDSIEIALNSINEQKLKELEIIVVDDGSSDNTIDLLEKRQKIDERIIILKQQHCGSGSARNLGIKYAKGEYISFLDADDKYYDREALEKIYIACHSKKANVGAGYRINVNDGLVHKIIYKDPLRKFHIKDMSGEWINFEDWQEDLYFQSFIYRREFLIDNNIEFPDYIRHQDPVFHLKALSTSKKFLLVPVTLYVQEGNVGRQSVSRILKNTNHILKGIRDNLKLADAEGYGILYSKLIDRLNRRYYKYIMFKLTPADIELLEEINEINNKSKYKQEFILLKSINELSYVREWA